MLYRLLKRNAVYSEQKEYTALLLVLFVGTAGINTVIIVVEIEVFFLL